MERSQTGSRVLGLGTYRPRRSVSNSEVCTRIDSDEEWIESRTGIRSRGHADAHETLSLMGTAAGQAALDRSGVIADEIDCVVVASMSNLVQTPPLAVLMAYELGAHRAGGFDVSAACAGFCHALGLASAMVRCGDARHVLVVGVERMTDIVEPTDRHTAFLFADGAGAAVVGPSDEPRIGTTVRGADGGSASALTMTASWGQLRDDPSSPKPWMRMDGRRVFRWAVESVVPAARRAVDAAGLDVADLGAFVPHQANLRMIEVLAERLSLPPSVAVATDIRDSGNTSAASVVLALDTLLHSGRVSSGDSALLITFGAGLNYAGQVVKVP